VKHLFWVLPGKLCGRSGPNHDPWNPVEFRGAGIGAVLSVNDGELVHAKDFASLGISHQCTPMSADAPPRPGDLELCLGNASLLRTSSRPHKSGPATAYWYTAVRARIGPASSWHTSSKRRSVFPRSRRFAG
jgi:hypothetical protein